MIYFIFTFFLFLIAGLVLYDYKARFKNRYGSHLNIFAKNKIYLTFDDTPSTEVYNFSNDEADLVKSIYRNYDFSKSTTRNLQQLLKEYRANAIFFVQGNKISDDESKELIKKLHNDGHIIGNHTENHRSAFDINSNELVKEIEDCELKMRDLGVCTLLFRPPYGDWNRYLTNTLLNKTKYLLPMLWTYSNQDWDKDLTKVRKADLIFDVETFLKNNSKKHIVFLQHDTTVYSILFTKLLLDRISNLGEAKELFIDAQAMTGIYRESPFKFYLKQRFSKLLLFSN